MLTPYLMIGQVLKPQGIHGEVKVKPETDDVARFLALRQVFVQTADGYAPRAVTCTRVHDGFAYLRFDDAADRDAAENLRGLVLYIDRAHAVELSEDENFICDIIGCEVVDTQGKPVGTLTDVMQPGANDVYVLDTPRGELLLPALKRVVLSVDTATRRIVLDEAVLPEVAVYSAEGEAID